MTTNTQTSELRMVRAVDGLDLALEPLQGLWSIEQYLKLTNQTNHLIEFTVLVLEDDAYAEHGVFHRGDQAVSKLLPGFSVSVDHVLDAK